MLLAKKIKLEVSDQDAATLEFLQGKCRGLYNWLVMRLRDGERWNFAQAKRSLQESKQFDPELDEVYGKLLAEVFYRLKAAMDAFFRRVEQERNQVSHVCAPATVSLPSAIRPCTSKSRERPSSCLRVGKVNPKNIRISVLN